MYAYILLMYRKLAELRAFLSLRNTHNPLQNYYKKMKYTSFPCIFFNKNAVLYKNNLQPLPINLSPLTVNPSHDKG